MKKITRILCLVLCLAMLAPGFIACASGETTSGAQINMYLSSEVYNFDPAYAHLDSSAAKLVGMMFEGLMKLDADGDISKGMLEKWVYTEDTGIDEESAADDKYTMVITLKDSAWSDGRALHADQFVYAWKRLLEPDFDGEGAQLLYDIVGAWERKNIGLSPDDIGLYADQKVLTIEFKHSIDPEEFLRKTASLCLVPLRQDRVDYYYNWSSANTTIVTNGPFTLVTYYPGAIMELGRNTYYYHDVTDEDKLPNPSKHVKPYKIIVDYSLNSEQMLQKFEEGQLFYISELPASKEIREQYKERAKLYDTLVSHVYYFNTTKEPFNNPVVRDILSKVISRTEIAAEVVFAKPATGWVPENIKDKTKKDDFAENNTAKIVSDAMSIADAKAALAAAGIDPASFPEFKLTVRVNADSVVDEGTGSLTLRPIKNSNKRIYDTVDYVVAQKVIEKWKELGFKCSIDPVNAKQYSETTSSLLQYRDQLVEAIYGTPGTGIKEEVKSKDAEGKDIVTENYVNIERAGFDVVAIDYQLLDTTAFSALAVFAADYSGAQLDEKYETLGHITGYNSEAYNKLIAEADAARLAGDKETLSAKLHEAEALLLKDCPVMPIFVYQDAIVSSKSLSNFKFSGWRTPIFHKVKLKNWRDYLPSSEEEEE